MLQGLANIHFEQPVGDPRTIDNAIQRARAQPESEQVIVISSGSEGETSEWSKMPKASKLDMLAKKALAATDNDALAEVVLEFSETLKSYSSRALTRQGFSFLDALYKQLADPSVFNVTPLR